MMKLKNYIDDDVEPGEVDDWGLNWVLANSSVLGLTQATPQFPPRNLEHENILRQFQESSFFSQPKPPRIEKICLIKTDQAPNDSVFLCNEQVYKLINNTPEYPEEPEEVIVPSYALDHMYAKKPKEPGTEPPKPVRKRARKKEVVKNQYIVQEVVQEEQPRINIIRQPLPGGSGYKPVGRPKILHTRSPIGSNSASSTAKEPKWKRTKPTASSHTRKPKIKPEPVPPTVFEESELPQLGAFVTVCDSDYTEVPYESQISTTNDFETKYLPSGYVELSISTEDLESNGLGDGDGSETELFLDTMFPMEEVEEALNADMDFCEINLSDALGGDISSNGNRYIHATVKALTSSKIHRKSVEKRDSSSSDFDCLDDNLEDSMQHYHRLTSLELRDKDNHIGLDEDESLSDFINGDGTPNMGQELTLSMTNTSPSRKSNRTLKTPTKLLDECDFIFHTSSDKRKNKSRPSCS